MLVSTDHTIVHQGNDRLTVLDENNQPLVVARRDTSGGGWVVSADGVEDVTVDKVNDAILQMTEHAVVSRHGTPDHEGFTTWVSHETRKLDGKDHFDEWQAKHGLRLKF